MVSRRRILFWVFLVVDVLFWREVQVPFLYGLRFAPWAFDVVTIGGLLIVLHWVALLAFGALQVAVGFPKYMREKARTFYLWSAVVVQLPLLYCTLKPVLGLDAVVLLFISAAIGLGAVKLITVNKRVVVGIVLGLFMLTAATDASAAIWDWFTSSSNYDAPAYSLKEFRATLPPVEVKNDLILAIQRFDMKFIQETDGLWEAKYDVATTVDFGAGLELLVPKDTVIKVEYTAEDTYEMKASNEVKLRWGCEIMSSVFSYAKIDFSYDKMKMTIVDTDMGSPLAEIIGRKDGWETQF